MKDLSSTSRSIVGRTGSDQNSSTADTVAISPGVTLASGTKACFKDPMFSSSDTDDCDADKLVIDLDSAGSTDASSTTDSKQTAASVPVPVVASTVSRTDLTKVRATEAGGSKSSSGSAHRQQSSSSSGKSGSGQQSDGLPSNQPPTDKGLKMKIKCSQVGGAGGPARHEISQFHTLVNSAVPSSSSSSASPSVTPANASASGAKTSGVERTVEKEKDALIRIDRIPTGGSGSHRKDHRTSVKERSMNSAKERSASEGQSQNLSAGSVANLVPSANISVATSSQPTSNVPVSSGIAVTKDTSNDISVKAIAVDVEKDTVSLTAWNNSSLSQQDPYEFNVKVEESIVGRPTKKIKLDKFDAACSPMPGCLASDQSTAPPAETRDVSVDACHVGVLTDPDCLGPCEPGTTVTLEGIVWNETENGLLVVNVTWRGKTYVGTLMDATKHHWAPPRFATDSPTSDLDGRTPKGRGKRGRTCTAAARSEINCSDRKLRSNRCAASAAAKSGISSAGSNSPVRSEIGPLGAPVTKRPRVSESQAGSSSSSSDASRITSKPSRSESRMSISADNESNGGEGVLIECPAPNCSKKYRHINGLRYHQSRSHPNMNFDDEADDIDSDAKLVSVNSKIRNDADGVDIESASDVDKNDVGEISSYASDTNFKQDKKSKSERSKSKSSAKQTLTDVSDMPRSPSKLSTCDAATVEKQKFRKKDRERPTDSAVLDPSPEVELPAASDVIKSSSTSAGKKCETTGQTVPSNEIPHFEPEVGIADGSVDDMVAVNRCSETVSVIRTAAEMDSTAAVLSNGEMNLNALQVACEISPMDNGISAEKTDANSSVFSSSMMHVLDRSGASPGPTLPLKRPKTTPTKFASDFDNPHSPAYSDISDANDSAPMLEKEATPSSAAVDDDNLTTSGNSLVERCPVSQRLADNFTGAFNGSTSSSSLYGQPPCLTPAVVSPPSLEVPLQQTVSVKVEKMDTSSINHQDERSGHSNNSRSMRPLMPARMPGETVRHPGSELSELTERSLGSLQRSVSRSHGSDASSPQPLQPAPPMLPPNMFMQYPYGPVPGGYPPLDLMQHPEYAQFERLVQQGMMRRPDQPPLSLGRPPADLPPVFKGLQCGPKPIDVDRKNKSDVHLPPGSLPTPPSLIPDRSNTSFEEQDSRIGKQKSSERREDGQRSSYPHQQYNAGAGGDRQRRHDDSSSAKDSGSNKPSAVVAPQARDRISASSSSSKVRPDDVSRSGSSSHDPSRSGHKSTPKGSSTLQESSSSRQSKDVSSERCGRDEKPMIVGRSGNSSNSYKKEDSGVSLSPITSVPLPLPATYPPYYPYLPAQFDPAAFYGGLNPMMGYAGAPPGPFLHPAQVGYMPSGGGDVGGMISPAVGPHLSPSDGKPRDGPPRGFYPGNDGPGSAPSTVHKIHELKEVAKGSSGSIGDNSPSVTGASTGSVLRDMRPESRSGAVGGSVGLPKDLERGGTSSPPTQRHVHTHHHMHMLGPAIPPLFGSVFPSDPSMMSSSQAGSTSSNCPSMMSRPFIGK